MLVADQDGHVVGIGTVDVASSGGDVVPGLASVIGAGLDVVHRRPGHRRRRPGPPRSARRRGRDRRRMISSCWADRETEPAGERRCETPMRALVVGASAGVGRAIAAELAGRGAALVVAARSHEALDDLARELRDRHDAQVTVLPLDLTGPDAELRAFLHEATAVLVDRRRHPHGGGGRRWRRRRRRLGAERGDPVTVNLLAPEAGRCAREAVRGPGGWDARALLEHRRRRTVAPERRLRRGQSRPGVLRPVDAAPNRRHPRRGAGLRSRLRRHGHDA